MCACGEGENMNTEKTGIKQRDNKDVKHKARQQIVKSILNGMRKREKIQENETWKEQKGY